MAKPLTLLHTSPVHVARFDGLRDRIAPGQPLIHVVRPDWLVPARAGGIDATLRTDISAAVTPFSLCTCTTLGAVAETLGALRIDRPMIEAAVATGGPVLLVYCVDSTARASVALLEDAARGRDLGQVILPLTSAWALFEAGDMAAYGAAIAAGVRRALADHPQTRVIVLAQASMDLALPFLKNLPIPVLSPAESALRAALGLDQ